MIFPHDKTLLLSYASGIQLIRDTEVATGKICHPELVQNEAGKSVINILLVVPFSQNGICFACCHDSSGEPSALSTRLWSTLENKGRDAKGTFSFSFHCIIKRDAFLLLLGAGSCEFLLLLDATVAFLHYVTLYLLQRRSFEPN